MGIKHHFGIYDQTQDFDTRMEQWYRRRIPGMRQWSAVRSLSGLIVERILTKRYPELAKVQRSCHSVHFSEGKIIPCGHCSKCQGVLLFLLANQVNPAIMQYDKEAVLALPGHVSEGKLRLDEDELDHAMFLSKLLGLPGKKKSHVETIHLNKTTSDIGLIPEKFRIRLLGIMSEYTEGFTRLQGDSWIPVKSPIEP
jgi:hypothetical protein